MTVKSTLGKLEFLEISSPIFCHIHEQNKRFSFSSFSYAVVMLVTIWMLITLKLDMPEFECNRNSESTGKRNENWFLVNRLLKTSNFHYS